PGPIARQPGTRDRARQLGPLPTHAPPSADLADRATLLADLLPYTPLFRAATGSWIMEGGTLRNGTLNLAEGAILRPTNNGNSLLQQMTAYGVIFMSPGPYPLHPETAMNLLGSFSLNGTLAMGSSASLWFND